MDGFALAIALGETVVSLIGRAAAGALVGEKAKGWLKDRAERESYQRALAGALEDLDKQFPAIAASFFDEAFLRGAVAEELAIFFSRHRNPEAKKVADAYEKQFSASHIEVLNAAEFFLRRVEERMKDEKPLQDLINRRQIEHGTQILEKLDRRLSGDIPSFGLAGNEEGTARPRPEIESAFRAGSGDVLAWPQTLDDGQWIPRAELELIETTVSSSDRSVTMLLGAPGSGKSALLSRLARRAMDAGHAVLAIKADQLPENVGSLKDLGEWLDLEIPVARALELVATQKKTLLLVDQLDALSELIDLRTGRLSALIMLVRRVSEIPNLHVVCSCRSFERRYDTRLSTIDAEEVQLPSLSWPTVSEILKTRKLSPDTWPEEFREVLCYPQCLKLFLRFFSGSSEAAVFKTYQAMLEYLWKERLFKDPQHAAAAPLLHRIATYMAEQETLFAPVARFEADRRQLDYLVSAHILQYDATHGQISFTHQTIFDFARARAFVALEGSLSRFVLERQTALFVRPKVWSAFAYLRATDAAAYRREYQALWNERGLREHLRLLLIDFAGMQESPQDFEIQALRSVFDDPRYRRKTLQAIAGQKAWFDEIDEDLLPQLMQADIKEAWPARWVLQRAWPFAKDEVLKLLQKHWFSEQAKREQAFQVLQELAHWDETALDFATRIFAAGGIHDQAVAYLVSTVSNSQPEIAVRLAAAKIRLRLRAALDAPPVPFEASKGTSEEEKQVARALHEPRKALKDLLGQSDTSWYDLPAVVEAAPSVWLKELWPILREALECIAETPSRITHTYRGDSSLFTHFEDNNTGEGRREYPILGATVIAVQELAKQNPTEFVDFLKENESSDAMSVHRLLAVGLSEIGTTYASLGLEYLLGDPRRLQLQNFYEDERETKLVIRTITPCLSTDDCCHLERAILEAKTTRPDFHEEDAETRFQRQKLDREFRLRLLLQFPQEKLSPMTRELIRSELGSAFPDFEDKRRTFEMLASSSRMSGDQMLRASDDAILKFIKEYPDDLGWGNIFDKKKRGGSIEVSRAFAEFAKKNPKRALQLCQRMDPTTHQRPLGYAIEALDSEALPLDDLRQVVHDFEAKGFRSEAFRSAAASALRKRVSYPAGLPDDMIDVLTRWLGEHVIEAENKTDSSDENEDREESLLWGYGRIMTVPHGTYPYLTAILFGLIARDPVPNARLFELLIGHLERGDWTRVWVSIAFDLSRNASRFDPSHMEAFIDALFAKNPKLLADKAGTWLVAHALRSVSASAAQRWLKAIRDNGPQGSQQAFGELLVLYALLVPLEEWPRREIETVLNGALTGDTKSQQAAVGLVHGAVHLWKDIEDKGFLNRILTDGMRSASPDTRKAALDWFRVNDHARLSASNRPIFEVLAETDAVKAVRSHSYLVEALADVIQDDPQIVCTICMKILDAVGTEVGSLAHSAAMDAEGIINIAMTMQRMDEPHRADGLTLFERLIELDAYRARDALQEVDRRPGTALHFLPRRRRGRRKKRI